MPYSTISTIMNKGIESTSVNKIITICHALNISTDDLVQGRIVPLKQNTTPTSVEDLIDELKQKLMNTDHLTINGSPATEHDLTAIINGIEVTIEITKRKNKGMMKND